MDICQIKLAVKYSNFTIACLHYQIKLLLLLAPYVGCYPDFIVAKVLYHDETCNFNKFNTLSCLFITFFKL